MHVSHQIAEILRNSGFTRVFGTSDRDADGVGFLLGDGCARLRFVPARHDVTAVGMAIGASRVTRSPQVCWVASDARVTRIAAGCATAMLDRDPILVLGARAGTGVLGHDEVHPRADSVARMRPITKYAAEISAPADTPRVLTEAIAAIRTGRPGPAFVSVPVDVLSGAATAPVPDPPPIRRSVATWDEADVQVWVRAFRAARSPLIVAGGGVVGRGLARAVAEFSERFAIPVAATYTAHGTVPVASDLYGGVVSPYADVLFELRYLDAVFADTDLIVLVGYDPVEHRPDTWRGRGGPKRVLALSEWPQDDAAFGAESSLVGACGAFLGRLAQELTAYRRPEPYMPVPGGSLAPENRTGPLRGPEILSALAEATGRFRLAADTGLSGHLGGVHFAPSAAGDYLASSGPAGVGTGLPLGMGAALADPPTRVVVLAGDDGFHSDGDELETAAHLGLRLVVVVADSTGDSTFRSVRAPGEGVSRRGAPTTSRPVDVVRLAEANGVPAVRAEGYDALLAALSASADARGPVLIQVPVTYSDAFVHAYEAETRGRPRTDGTSAPRAPGTT
ncbi:thiamine pyrophosphate-dependent enzyme [Streptomyces sp. AN091965]|uniref:thiamine pyrophosphate-dependent enzyme n=1 Tax=Streptomyces sp. AN091965 TaxID=2927803 RepID=UPI001F6060CF|nr:thiamine pyrophosphate-dependent enzyme [Streptomyces sp. AN091965]MCI3934379.1 thiamine pyrophosphate-dependent enzyme [Streptomyces sp. AN091965]